MVFRAGQRQRWPIRDVVLTTLLVILFHPCVVQTKRCGDVTETNVNHWTASVYSYFDDYFEISCTWNITVDEGYTILAAISISPQQWMPDCRVQYFKIYDDDNPSNGTLLGTFCESGLSTVESSSNVLLTEFYTDGTAPYTDASVDYFAVNESKECGVIDLTDSEGSFQIQSSVRRNGACVWNITAEEGFNILLRIMEYSLSILDINYSCNASFLKVYDGNKEDESHLVRNLCSGRYGRAKSGLVISTTNSLLVVLTIQERSGFSLVDLRANYTAVNATLVNRNCGEDVTGSEGNITSPNYPDNYDNLMACQWLITVDPAYSVQLDIDYSFDNSHINNYVCNSDSLTVLDGNGTADHTLCRSTPYNRGYQLRTNGNQAIVTFTTDQEGTDSGFTIHWNSVCERTLDSYSDTLQSPNYPDNYPGNLSCVYSIGYLTGYTVIITFHNFKLEGPSSNDLCTKDYLEVGYRSSRDLTPGIEETQRYCGDNIPSTLTLYPPVDIRFVTDLNNSSSGYQASYEFFEADCGQLLFTGETGTVTSPNYPGTYPSELNCTYVIRVEPGQSVYLVFDYFSLGGNWWIQEFNCINAFALWSGLAALSVFYGEVSADNVLAANDNLIFSFCGARAPLNPVYSTSSVMTLFFVAGYNFDMHGFSATYTSIGTTSNEFTRQLSLYPYGLVNGDSKLPQNHDEVKEVPLDTGFPIGNKLQYNLFVANKGLVSFGKPEQGKQLTLKSDKAMICPYHSDIGAWGSNSGVYYQVYTDNKEVLDKASNEIREFTEHRQYTASLVVVVTWDHVAHISSHNAWKEQATVQLALISDGRRSYGLVYYKKGEMKWSMLDNQPLIIGFSDGQKDKPFYSMYSNTTEAFTQFDSIKGNTGRYGMWLYTLGDYYSPDQKCQDWYKQNLRLKEERLTAFQRLPQCPCSTRFLWGSWRFFNSRNEYKVLCFRMNKGISRQFASHGKECCYKEDGRRRGSSYLFITDPPYAGSATAFNPAFWSLQADYQQEDRQAHDVCCYNTTSDRYCNMFYELRPVGKCSIKIPFGVTTAWGDPHIKTLDGKEYTFNGWGEYTMITLTSGNLTFSLQGRTGLAETESGSITNATVFTAFAAEENGVRVFVGLDPNTNESLIIYGNDTDYSRAFRDAGDDDVLVDSEAYMLKRSNESFVITFASEIQMTILIGYKSLDIFTSIPLQYRNLTKGLLGNFNGVKDDDFVLPGGTSLNSDLTDRQIYEEFGPTWAVTASNSVLRYGPREGPEDFAHPEFSPIFLDEVAMDTRQAAEDLCGATNVACIYDYIATGSAAIANASGNTAIIAEEREKVTQNTVPVLNFNGTVQVTSGQIVSFNLQGHDPDTNDVLTYYVLADDEGNVEVDSRTGDVSLTADYKKPVSYSFYTTDSQNVQSPVRDLKLVMCSGCTNHGTCDFSRTTISGVTGFLIAACDCNPAWTGDHCDQDYDACDESPCDVHQVCTDLTPDQQGGNDVGFNCSGCPVGFDTDPTDSTRCMDKDECSQQSNCNQLCTNLPGSFSCTCGDGYRLSSDDVSCDDINECAEKTDGCQQQCVNTEGSYRCQCFPGYTLSERATCIADSTTADLCSRARCDHACTATTDSSGNTIPHCFCFNGYKLDPANNRSCVDRDECSEGVCSQSCTNTQGSFACTCYTGHVMSSDQRTCNPCPKLRYGPECRHTCECSGRGLSCHPVTGCVCQSGWTGSQCQDDVNECEESPDVCGEGKLCVNNNGSYICLCPDGYAKDSEGVCQDINECAEGAVSNTCGELEQCHNVPGSFYCTCRSGYTLIYGQCTDVDECSSSSLNQCQQLCHNVPGDYNCECRYGYRLNVDRVSCSPVADVCAEFEGLNCDHGCSLNDDDRAFCFCWLGYVLGPDLQSCQDVNECANSPCEHQCENSPGSYRCLCNRGFSLDTTSGDCIDINECAVSETNKCTQRCDNTPGSYRCSCDVTGYVLDNDGVTCSAKSALVRVAMTVTVQITAPPDLSNPDGTTNAFWGKMVEDALYNKLRPDVPGLEAVIVVSLRPGSLIIDSVVVVNNETHPYSPSNLTFALMNMVQGQITINNQTGNISLIVGSVTVDASARACDVYEQIATCSAGYQCMMQGGSLSCRQIPQNEDGDQALLIAVVVSAGVLVIVVVIIVIVCIKRKKAARKRAMPVHLADLNKETAMSGKTG